MRIAILAFLTLPFLALAACTGDYRIKSPDEVVVTLSPAVKERLDAFCDATLASDNMAAVRSYANLYASYIQPLAPERLPSFDLDELGSRELVVKLADARVKACDLYAAGQLLGTIAAPEA